MEGLERTRMAEDTLAERGRENTLKQEARNWAYQDRQTAQQDRQAKLDLELLRRRAGEDL